MSPRPAAEAAVLDWHVALVGNPNCGKTALFNLLTGARQKVANYAGVTVERKVGTARLQDGRTVTVIDLPGAYSLNPATPDEQVTLEVIEGRREGERVPDLIVAVVDATNLRMNLRLVLELQRLGRPMVVALNMADVARAQGLEIDVPRLAQELGCPVVETVAVRHNGHAQLLQQIQAAAERRAGSRRARGAARRRDPAQLQREVRRILAAVAPRRAAVAALPHPPRRGGDAPGVGPAAAGRAAVPDLPGGVLLGRRADGRHQGRDGRPGRLDAGAHGRRARCAACWSTASSPASAACWCSCRRS